MPVNERVALERMLKYCEAATKYAVGLSYDDFVNNELYLTFSVFALSQLGELANRLDNSLYEKYPQIPWNAMRGLRNHIVHNYDGIEFKTLWSTITINIPALAEQLQNILHDSELINALSWNAPEACQQGAKAHIAAQPDFPYRTLIQPLGRKDCWDNCAEILCKLSDGDLQPLLPGMLEWLQDLNWPGALMVQDRLTKVQIEMLKPVLEATVRRACEEDDDIWLEWLSELLRNPQLADALDADVLAILQTYSGA